MQLILDGRQLPGIKKKADQMLRANKPLPFKKVELMVGGAEVHDLPDEEYGDTEDRPASVLPDAPDVLSRLGLSMAAAARGGGGFCEECEAPAAARPAAEGSIA